MVGVKIEFANVVCMEVNMINCRKEINNQVKLTFSAKEFEMCLAISVK